MSLKDIYLKAVSDLSESGIEEASFDARLLLEFAFSVQFTNVLINPDIDYNSANIDLFDKLVNQRKKGRPLQYILGKWEFMGYEFNVGEGVLIPRSETEILVEYAVNELKDMNNPVVYDLCSGTGCIGLSIKKFIPQARVFMVEISDDAIHFLNMNRESLGLMRDTCLIKGDITLGYEAFLSLPKPDVILSNPPYIKSEDIRGLQREVQFEPSLALDGGEDGFDFYRVLSEKWLPFINDGGFIAVECGEEQAEDISAMFECYCQATDIINDYAGTGRVVIGKK